MYPVKIDMEDTKFKVNPPSVTYSWTGQPPM